MLEFPVVLNIKRIAILLTLVTILTSVYMFTYSGRIESSDTLGLFDATSSLVQYGDGLLDSSAWYTYPPPSASGEYPLARTESEPMQPILAAPLFWAAYHLPGIGMVHAVWLFNVLVCAMAGGVFFVYALVLGYSELTAAVGTLLMGLCTIIWPYSKTFFREPLALLMILLAALFIECWRQRGYRSLVLFLAAIFAVVGGYLSKEAVIFAVPALLTIAAPGFQFPAQVRRVLVIVSTIIAGIFILVSILPTVVNYAPLYSWIADVTGLSFLYVERLHTALHSYLLSIGGSVWGTSPILLLAIPGLVLLYRQGAYRYVLIVLLALLSFAVGYAVLRGAYWFGGLSWPPRFLVPAIPLLAVGILPVLERVMKRPVRYWQIVVLAIIVIYSLWVQLSGILLPWSAYGEVLPAEANGLGEWGGGLNEIRYVRWALLPPLWSQHPLDLVWVRVNVPWWPLIFVGLAFISSSVLAMLLKGGERLRLHQIRLVMCLPIVLLGLIWLGLRLIYHDPYYLGDREPLHAFVPTIESVGQKGDVLLLDNTHYSPFFMNYGKFDHPRVITLSDQPGEQPSPEQAALVTSDNPDNLLLPVTTPLVFNLSVSRDHLWLLADSGPWLPWRIRPVERFMAQHFYPIRELSTEPADPEIRLIEYSTVDAPDPFSFVGPENLTNLNYGDSIHLVGFTLPSGKAYQPGDVLPISLYWSSSHKIDQNYTVAWFLANQDGSRVVQGMDTQPYWGFAPTSTWKTDVPIWDNRAMRLPGDLESGVYQLWIRLYQSDRPDVLLPVTGENVRVENIGVLPVRIDIAP